MTITDLRLNETGSDRVAQTARVSQSAIAQLKAQPGLVSGILAALPAITGLIIIGVQAPLPSQLTFLPYALVLFSGIALSGAYLSSLKVPVKQSVVQATPTEWQIDDTSWPQEKSLDSLATKLSDLSPSERKMLRIIRDTNGILAFRLADQLGFPRAEVVYRCSELARQELVRIEHFTDISYSLPEVQNILFQKRMIQDILNLS